MTPPRETTRSGPAPAVPLADESADPGPRQRRLFADVVVEDDGWNEIADAAGLAEAAVLAVAGDEQVAAMLPAAAAEVVVVLADDDRVARLNGQFRGKDKPTNVLSFPSGPGTPAGSLADGIALGDIVLALATLRGEAEAMGLPLAHHLQHLVVHGTLHLLGFDHLTAADAEHMEEAERRILARLGVPDPYAGSEPVEPSEPQSSTDHT